MSYNRKNTTPLRKILNEIFFKSDERVSPQNHGIKPEVWIVREYKILPTTKSSVWTLLGSCFEQTHYKVHLCDNQGNLNIGLEFNYIKELF